MQLQVDAANLNTEQIRALYAKNISPRFRERQQLEFQFAKGLEEALFRIKFSRSEQAEIEAAITSICFATDLEDISDSEDRLFIKRWRQHSPETLPIELPPEQTHRPQSKKKNTLQSQAKTLRSVYISLAKLQHPDGELNEKLRLEKEAKMKRITQAYQAQDLQAMLLMEAEFDETSDKKQDSYDIKQIHTFNNILKDKIAALRVQHHQYIAFLERAGLSKWANSSSKKLAKAVKTQGQQLAAYNEALSSVIRALSTETNRKEIMAYVEYFTPNWEE